MERREKADSYGLPAIRAAGPQQREDLDGYVKGLAGQPILPGVGIPNTQSATRFVPTQKDQAAKAKRR